MRYVEPRCRASYPQRYRDRVECVGAEVIDLVERAGAAKRLGVGIWRQAFHEGGIGQLLLRRARWAMPGAGSWFVIEAGGPKQIEIDHDGSRAEVGADRPRRRVRDGGGAGRRPWRQHGDDAADGDFS